MGIFERIMFALQSWKMETPTGYGTFHLICLGLVALLFVVLCVFFRNADDKTYRRILLISGIIMIVLEGFKQLYNSVHFTDGVMEWGYQWYMFPYQFCSTPMFALPLIGLLKDGRVRDSLSGFMCFFAFMAGFMVFSYPDGCFTNEVVLNIQTMEHHGLQTAIGLFIVVYNRKKLTLKYFAKSIPSFLAFVAVAMVLNLTVAPNINGDTFNMFYISPYFPSSLPLLSLLYNDVNNPVMPYGIFLPCYLLGFCLVGLIGLGLERGVLTLFGCYKYQPQFIDLKTVNRSSEEQ